MPQAIERARPLLGTIVAIRVENDAAHRAIVAIDRAFSIIAMIHQLMSFHEAGSDVSKLNREAAASPVRVHPHTFSTLQRAVEFAEVSGGIFDITVARELVGSGLLPRPADAPEADPAATWRDIGLGPDCRVRFARPLWIDLGGIAKGYAVDCGMAALADGPEIGPATQSRIDAGGDIRVHGPEEELVRLDLDCPGGVPVVAIAQGSLASSTGSKRWKGVPGAHLEGIKRRSVGTEQFVSVAAERCIVADALTKVVLAMGDDADSILCKYGATAYLCDGNGAWRTLGEG